MRWGARYVLTVLLACIPYGCSDDNEGPCGGCSTSSTKGGGTSAGKLDTHMEGALSFDGDTASLVADRPDRIDASPFRVLVSNEGILVYSDRPCAPCDTPLPVDPDAGDADADAGDAEPPVLNVPQPGEPRLVLKLVFGKSALTERGRHDAAGKILAQTCRNGTLSASFFDATSCDATNGSTSPDELTLGGTITVEESSPHRYTIDVTIPGHGTLKLSTTETRGPETVVPGEIECHGSYG
jgi:hypothetical protein